MPTVDNSNNLKYFGAEVDALSNYAWMYSNHPTGRAPKQCVSNVSVHDSYFAEVPTMFVST
jgi:hypothetical protein